MTGRKRAGGEKKATTVVANHPDDLKGVLKQIGGSRSDHWNHVLASQAIQTLWLKHSDKESCDQQYSATVAALIGIGPRDELEANYCLGIQSQIQSFTTQFPTPRNREFILA